MRIPTPLYERVKVAAGEKSVNAEIVQTLEAAYPEPWDFTDQFASLVSDVIVPIDVDRDTALVRLNDLLQQNNVGMTASYEGGETVTFKVVDPKLRETLKASPPSARGLCPTSSEPPKIGARGLRPKHPSED